MDELFIKQNTLTDNYDLVGSKIVRETTAGSFSGLTEMDLPEDLIGCEGSGLANVWARAELRLSSRPIPPSVRQNMSIVDLFCGCGGLTQGVRYALESVGIGANVEFACDAARDSIDVYKANHRPRVALHSNVLNLINAREYTDLEGFFVPDVNSTELSSDLNHLVGKTDFFIAGPPCEGNSNLNNKTRRVDPRNEFYILAVLIGIKLQAKAIIIVNVPSVKNAKQDVLNRSLAMLAKAGYDVKNAGHLLYAKDYLVGQMRRRHFLVAVKSPYASSTLNPESLCSAPLSVMDVIGDLVSDNTDPELMSLSSKLSKENEDRIEYLFKHNLYNLPDEQRPDCHKLKDHNYVSVYGRMKPNEPSPTLTTGFQSPGRGRFIHPTRPRGLTPREGARIQGFPDYYRWRGIGLSVPKNGITRLIGDAVPPNLGRVAALLALAKI